MTPVAAAAAEVLAFWFEDCAPDQWFTRDGAFDDAIRRRFAALCGRAAGGALDDWQDTAEGALALVILLDQFPRNMFRDDPRAFATDGQARAVARTAIERGLDAELSETQRKFLYMPFQHSEDLADQRLSVRLVAEQCSDEKTLDYARQHLEVIERFGRFPHRNAVLGRESSPEEIAFLQQPGASF